MVLIGHIDLVSWRGISELCVESWPPMTMQVGIIIFFSFQLQNKSYRYDNFEPLLKKRLKLVVAQI